MIDCQTFKKTTLGLLAWTILTLSAFPQTPDSDPDIDIYEPCAHLKILLGFLVCFSPFILGVLYALLTQKKPPTKAEIAEQLLKLHEDQQAEEEIAMESELYRFQNARTVTDCRTDQSAS
jgi:hypothetical protein